MITKKAGGLLTYIKNKTFTEQTIPSIINPDTTKLQIIKIHLTQDRYINIIYLYIHQRKSKTL